MIAVVEGWAVGHVEFYLHPDGLAVEVGVLEVAEDYRGLGLASLLMDRLHEEHPRAWVNHGLRSVDGAHWWNRYQDPAPARNIHNRPPAEWARYFRAPRVGAQRAANRGHNKSYDLNGHKDAEYRYGERLEEEYQRHAHAFEPDTGAPRVDPARQDLHAGHVVLLPPGLHRYVHDPARDAAARAQALLEHLGHGNLPRSGAYTGYWNITAQGALTDAWLSQLFQDEPPAETAAPVTHLVYRAHPLNPDAQSLPRYTASFNWVEYKDAEDVSVDLAGMSWRSSADLNAVNRAVFDSPVPAAIRPDEPRDASPQYRDRYNNRGMLRPHLKPSPTAGPFETRRAEIGHRAQRLIQEITARSEQSSVDPPPRQSGRAAPAPPDATPPRPPGPRL